ncbi:hypothetical protein, partial [Litorisediminicola beolgyonensis]
DGPCTAALAAASGTGPETPLDPRPETVFSDVQRARLTAAADRVAAALARDPMLWRRWTIRRKGQITDPPDFSERWRQIRHRPGQVDRRLGAYIETLRAAI